MATREALEKRIRLLTTQRCYDSLRPFCFNVKLKKLNFDFDNMLSYWNAYQEVCGGQPCDDPAWVDAARKVYENESNEDMLHHHALDAAKYQFIEENGETHFDELDDGTKIKGVSYSFVGRSDGWLSLDSALGYDFTSYDSLENLFLDVKLADLRLLAKFIKELGKRCGGNNPKREVEHQAASLFFRAFEQDIQDEFISMLATNTN